MNAALLLLGAASYAASVVWSVWITRRLTKLERAEAERAEAEDSTIIRRPKVLQLKSVPWVPRDAS